MNYGLLTLFSQALQGRFLSLSMPLSINKITGGVHLLRAIIMSPDFDYDVMSPLYFGNQVHYATTLNSLYYSLSELNYINEFHS